MSKEEDGHKGKDERGRILLICEWDGKTPMLISELFSGGLYFRTLFLI